MVWLFKLQINLRLKLGYFIHTDLETLDLYIFNPWECWFSLSYGLSITSNIITLYLLENKLFSSEENSSLIEHYYGSCYDSLSGLYPRVTLKGSSNKGKGGGRIVNVGSLLKWVWLLHQITCEGSGCFLMLYSLIKDFNYFICGRALSLIASFKNSSYILFYDL